MGSINKVYTLFLTGIIATAVLFIIQPAKAEVDSIGTSCSIIVNDVVEGQTVHVVVQIFPTPPSGEIFNNLTIWMTSPMQGVWGNGGNGPWSKGYISTDTNGKATVTFDIITFSGYWNIGLYFEGQYFANNTIYYQPGNWQTGFIVSPDKTPTPSPTAISTLGPMQIRSAGDGGTNVQIINPQNKSNANNPIQLLFCVKASLLPFCYSSVGNIGYSVDGGTINSVNNFINQTIIHNAADDATVWANVTLSSLSEGSHYITVYFGWQFSGINQRYEVFAYANVDFLVSSKTTTPSLSSTSTITPKPVSSNYLSSQIFLIEILILVIMATVFSGLLVYLKKHRLKSGGKS